VAISNEDLDHLGRCVELARSAYEAGDEPFGSLLLDGNGETRFEDRNRVAGGDATRHPEFAIARWAASNLSPAERVRATVYTSGEHCPMCSAAHAWRPGPGASTPPRRSSRRAGCGNSASRRARSARWRYGMSLGNPVVNDE
jgi:tRNA(Arg) A34 adenosine deaminase TadA